MGIGCESQEGLKPSVPQHLGLDLTPSSSKDEMAQRTFSLVTAVLVSLIALLHAVRLVRGWQVTVEGAVMPIWISWIGLAIAAYLAYQGFLLSKTPTK